jgi:hypothetical protein
MGIFDIFSNSDAQQAAQAQIQGLNAGNALATGNINQGIGALNTNYTAALQPFLQNYSQAQGGTTQLGNLLGLNGASGNQSALTALQNTPGYQFQLQQGDAAINAQAAASGQNASGNQAIALSNYNQGLAGTTYNQAVQNLMPFLGASQNAASGIAGVNTGLGNQTANQYDTLANLNYQTQTGIGNANANADLAAYNASGNFWNMLGSLGGMKTSGGGTVGGNALSGIGSAISSFLPMLSDARLKDDIEKVGELYDGQNVYAYRYKGDVTPHIGLMAQEVEQRNPAAVVEIGGYKAVRYDLATRGAADLARFLEAA